MTLSTDGVSMPKPRKSPALLDEFLVLVEDAGLPDSVPAAYFFVSSCLFGVTFDPC